MIYFKFVNLVLGSLMLLSSLMHYLLPHFWPDLMLNSLMPEKKPKWMIPLAGLILIWVLFTWYEFSLDRRPLYFVVSLCVTLGIVKAFVVVAAYERVRNLLTELRAGEQVAFHILLLSSFLIGLGLILIGFFLR